MKNKHIPVEIDFDDLVSVKTFESNILYNINLVNALPNPYVGNKRKVIFEICSLLEKNNIIYNSILDLFSGSSCFSIVMKLMEKRVISNDILTSSYVYASAFVEQQKTLSQEKINFLLKNKAKKTSTFVKDNFLNRFTLAEAEILDFYYTNILEMFSLNKKTDGLFASDGCLNPNAAIAFANMQLFILDKCFVGGRLNNGQVLAKRDHRISHKRNNGYEMNFNNLHWYSFAESDKNNHKAFCLDATDCLNDDFLHNNKPDIVYMDPPYGGQQSDYAKMYSFFESYIYQKLHDQWRTQKQNKFSQKKIYEDNFRKVIEESLYIPTLVLSYNDSSWADIQYILNIIKDFRNIIDVKKIEYKYKYRNNKNKLGVEYIIIAM